MQADGRHPATHPATRPPGHPATQPPGHPATRPPTTHPTTGHGQPASRPSGHPASRLSQPPSRPRPRPRPRTEKSNPRNKFLATGCSMTVYPWIDTCCLPGFKTMQRNSTSKEFSSFKTFFQLLKIKRLQLKLRVIWTVWKYLNSLRTEWKLLILSGSLFGMSSRLESSLQFRQKPLLGFCHL